MSEVNLKNLTTENNVLNTREIFRHETDTGSVIKFEQFGETVKLFVPDAKYRSKLIDFRPQAPARLCDLELTIFELARERDFSVFLQDSSSVDAQIDYIIQSLLRVKTSIADVIKEVEDE